jgi:Cu/Ag efflux protein CusF
MKKLTSLFAAIGTLAAMSSPAFAAVDDIALMKNSHDAMGMTSASSRLTDAIVTGTDPANGMITLEHGELKNIGMPAMTMAYKVQDTAVIQRLQRGEKVKVRIENVSGTPTVIRLVTR